ncbi:MAG: DUF1926 domain-containing protein [Spirochaetaceae bacterium]|nr:MAG: DUF1926 domain-containing protein [Spirochaetaceae bacterium]
MKVRLIFGTTNSQPTGIDDCDIEDVYQRAYKPFLRAVYNQPQLPVTLHYSGHLLQWLDRHHSEFTDVLSEMGQRRQVELLGGAFYEPVLALIPRPDRLGQIERMTTHLRKRFGRRPRGAWITEQVWEPSLPSLLKTSGIDYTFLYDVQFAAGGLSGEALRAPCITEDEGKTVMVFPLVRTLCDAVGVLPPAQLIDRLREFRTTDENQLLSLIVNGARYAEQYQTGEQALDWIRQFLDLLVANRDWIEVVTPWRYLRRVTPRRRGYFPPTSYRDLMQWCAADDLNNGHHTTGFFRQFLTHYPESNLMYAKMQYTHILVNQLRGDKYRKQLAREELWKGQCHNAYWHGPPGGIYQNLLRKRVYSCLIEAEKVTREKGIFIPSVLSLDFDMDGLAEYLFQGHDINAYVHLIGGVVFELDYLPAPWNYLDTLGRHPELYHRDEDGVFDTYLRRAFVDHFYAKPPRLADFVRAECREIGNLAGTIYQTEQLDRDHNVLELTASIEDDDRSFTLTKRFHVRSSELCVDYTISNSADSELSGWFASEINLGFLSDDEDALTLEAPHNGQRLPARGPHTLEVSSVRFGDRVNGVELTAGFSREATVWVCSLTTECRCGPGRNSQYQGSCVVPGWDVVLQPGQSWSVSLTLELAAG